MSLPHDDKRSAASAAAGKPSLEDLLRLKRHERPDAAFWEDFDRGLRQKQLAAIIEPRPWWLGLALLGRRLVPVGMPVSATAVALFAVMVVRTQAPFAGDTSPVEFGPRFVETLPATEPALLPPEQSTPRPASTVVASAPESSPVSTTRAPAKVADTAPSPAKTAPAMAVAANPSEAPAPAPAPAPRAASPAPSITGIAGLLALTPAPAANTPPTPSQLAIARNLAALGGELPTFTTSELPAVSTNLVGVPSPGTTQTANASLEMVVQNPRHARALVALAEMNEFESNADLAQVRERITHRLANDDTRLGSASRVGVGGNRFSLSF